MQKAPISFVISVCPCGLAWLPLYVFKLNLILVTFLKIFRDKSILGYNHAKLWGTLHTKCTYMLLSLVTLNHHKSTDLDWNDIRLLGHPCRYKHYANALQVTLYVQFLSSCFLKYTSSWVDGFQDLATAVQCPVSCTSSTDYICLCMDWLRGWWYT